MLTESQTQALQQTKALMQEAEAYLDEHAPQGTNANAVSAEEVLAVANWEEIRTGVKSILESVQVFLHRIG